MRERQPSIADSLADAHILLDGRYRIEALVRRSDTATVHLATHRNGSSAWLKLPISAAYGDAVALEARIANGIGSPLIVRDDGTTADGVPYLVLDPPEAESVAALRVRERKGPRLPFTRVMTAGDALARMVESIHAMGFVTAGMKDEDILVFANGDVALLDLHALAPLTDAGVARDLLRLRSVLATLATELSDAPPDSVARGGIKGALAAGYPDIGALRVAWRAASPEPIELPVMRRAGNFADLQRTPFEQVPMTPYTLVVDSHGAGDSDASIIGYLRSGGLPSAPQQELRPPERSVMYAPLSRMAEVPRLVKATSRVTDSVAQSPRKSVMVGTTVAVPAVALLVLAAALASSSKPAIKPLTRAVATAALSGAEQPVMTSPPTESGLPESEPVELGDDLELYALLRTEGAPPGREVFLDGHSLGKTPLSASVPCGPHLLQMVKGAPKIAVDLPCGGGRVVRYDAKGRWSLKSLDRGER